MNWSVWNSVVYSERCSENHPILYEYMKLLKTMHTEPIAVYPSLK
jgi:hypothetical protein